MDEGMRGRFPNGASSREGNLTRVNKLTRARLASLGSRDEEGLTLIELMIVVILLPIVIGAIAVALITVFKNDTGIQTRLSDSHDAQITSTYFVRDVQGAQQVTSQATPVCGPTGTGYTQVLGLEWASGGVKVAYVYEQVAGSAPDLAREFCSGGSPSRSVVAHGFTSTPMAFICESAGCARATSYAGFSSGFQSAEPITQIYITVPDTSSNFSYSQLAAPRFASSAVSPPGPSGGGGPTTYQLILLGGGGSSCPLLTIGQNGKVTPKVAADAVAINTTCTNAISQGNNSSLSIKTIATQVSPPNLNYACMNGCTPSAYYNPASPDSGPAVFNSQAVTDPYLGLTAPNEALMTPGACTGPTSNTTCTAGLYTPLNCPSFSPSGVTVTFGGGTSVFDGCALNLPNNAVLNAVGVFFYFKSEVGHPASMQVGKSPGLTITAATTGPGCAGSTGYPCVALWQDKADTTPWMWGGGSTKNGTICVGYQSASTSCVTADVGAIYMPDAGLTVSNVQTLSIEQAVVQSLNINNVGTTTIG